MERPDLSQVSPSVREYIAFLEAELEALRARSKPRIHGEVDADLDNPAIGVFPDEPPTTLHVITYTNNFLAKRTARHLYSRQRRGGMGVFDLETPEDEPLAGITVADEGQSVLLFTSLGRVFRLPVSQILTTDVRARGQTLAGRLILLSDESLISILPDVASGAVAMVSRRGWVRYLRHHIFGEYMKPGVVLMDVRQFGPLAAACRTTGDSDLFVATRQGKAIRFSAKLVPPAGGPGIRLEENDSPVAITAVDDESTVFMVDSEGNGTIRAMASFAANKSAGGGGKIAMKTDSLVSACRVEPDDEIFLISHLGKIIRFYANEVPVKDGIVQGVHCMALRADQVAAGLATH